jgi:hypothetical protein
MTKEIQKICNAIANGEETEKYTIWKTSSEKDIRKALAKAGYWPEYFIHDEDNFVRVAVLNKHPEYVNELLKNPINHSDIHWFVYRKPSPDIRILKALSEYGANEHQTTGMQATTLNLKLKELETVGTPLQSTMTRRQLFEAKSPLWASNLDINRMYQVLTTVQNAREKGVDKELMEYFDDLCNTERFFMTLNIIAEKINFYNATSTRLPNIENLIATFL